MILNFRSSFPALVAFFSIFSRKRRISLGGLLCYGISSYLDKP